MGKTSALFFRVSCFSGLVGEVAYQKIQGIPFQDIA